MRTRFRVGHDNKKQLLSKRAGFDVPRFVIDLPVAGKRLMSRLSCMMRLSGVSTYTAPGLSGNKGKKVHQYYDPVA